MLICVCVRACVCVFAVNKLRFRIQVQSHLLCAVVPMSTSVFKSIAMLFIFALYMYHSEVNVVGQWFIKQFRSPSRCCVSLGQLYACALKIWCTYGPLQFSPVFDFLYMLGLSGPILLGHLGREFGLFQGFSPCPLVQVCATGAALEATAQEKKCEKRVS